MKKLTKEKKMTIREVAGILGISADSIYNSAKELYPDLFNTGKTTYFDEKQVTAIKFNLRKNSEVDNQPKTNLEKALLIKQAMRYQQEIIEGLQAENKNLAAAFGREVLAHRETRTGLQFYQRVSEEGGLMLSDRDDVLAPYRDRR